MTEQAFIRRREGDWREIERIISGGRRDIAEKAAWFPEAFRELAGDLNTAKSSGFDPALIDRLNRMTLEGNQILYGRKPFRLKAFAEFFFGAFPRAVRAKALGFAMCSLIFYGLALFTALVCIRFPDFVYELLSPWDAANLEEMYNPASDYYLRPREIGTDADMFGFYIYNNISIAFRTFAGGIVAGIGSLLMLAFNGIFMGAAAAHIINCGFQSTFFSFVAGHSGFELTAIVLASQAGLNLGWRLFVTKGLSRGDSVREAGRESLPIIAGAAVMLVAAALLEAFWSSRHEIPEAIRLAVGGIFILLIAAFFLFSGRTSGDAK